jgi:hypothetical protein
VPIVALIPLLAFYIYLAWKQANANDELIAELETDPAMAKTTIARPGRSAGMAERNSRLAVSAARGISGRHHRHHHSDGLVDHAERAAGRTGRIRT